MARTTARARGQGQGWRHPGSSISQALLLLLLFRCCCSAALLSLAHPASAAAMCLQQQWQDGCGWHESSGAAKQQGCGCRWCMVVLAVPDAKILCRGHFCVGADTHVHKKSETLRQVADMLPTYPATKSGTSMLRTAARVPLVLSPDRKRSTSPSSMPPACKVSDGGDSGGRTGVVVSTPGSERARRSPRGSRRRSRTRPHAPRPPCHHCQTGGAGAGGDRPWCVRCLCVCVWCVERA